MVSGSTSGTGYGSCGWTAASARTAPPERNAASATGVTPSSGWVEKRHGAGRTVALDHEAEPGGDGAAVGQAGDGDELRLRAGKRGEQRAHARVDVPGRHPR